MIFCYVVRVRGEGVSYTLSQLADSTIELYDFDAEALNFALMFAVRACHINTVFK